MNNLVPIGDLERMADAMAGSGLFGVKTKQQALALMLVAQAQGISPATACVDFDIIQGKPAMTARAVLARFQQAGGTIKWLQYTDDVCEAAFTHPQCPDAITIKWTMQDAARAGLNGKDNWRKYPRQMLSSRVMSEGVDRCYPAASGGFYTPEIVQDFTREKDITPSAGIEETLTGEEIARANEVAGKMHEWLAPPHGSIGDAVYELENAALNAEQTIYLWAKCGFDSKQRSAMKKEQARIKAAAQRVDAGPPMPGNVPIAGKMTGTSSDTTPALAAPEPKQERYEELISDSARKRLEARISELKIDREQVKQYIGIAFGRAHFSELTKEEYRVVDSFVEILGATDLNELAGIWAALVKDHKITLTAAKNARKAELEADQIGSDV